MGHKGRHSRTLIQGTLHESADVIPRPYVSELVRFFQWSAVVDVIRVTGATKRSGYFDANGLGELALGQTLLLHRAFVSRARSGVPGDPSQPRCLAPLPPLSRSPPSSNPFHRDRPCPCGDGKRASAIVRMARRRSSSDVSGSLSDRISSRIRALSLLASNSRRQSRRTQPAMLFNSSRVAVTLFRPSLLGTGGTWRG